MPLWVQALGWGLLSGSALVIGAAIGYFSNLPQRMVAAVMAFGSGVLISALSLELMEKAFLHGGYYLTAAGFLAGALTFTLANIALAQRGAKHRKRSQNQQKSEQEQKGSGMAIAVGSLLDGIPESVAIGVGMITGGVVSVVTVAAVFLSNLPEGLSSAAGMKKAGRSKTYVFGIWAVIALLAGVSSWLGYAVFSHFSTGAASLANAVAAGAILAMLADTMIPEAFESAHNWSGLITVAGFLLAFFLGKFD